MSKEYCNFAPVVIPTLCRSSCFVQCIESLAKCEGANKTDVYIGLDYPSNDHQWKGYEIILNYLNTAKLPFKSLNVIKRESNLGVYGPQSNLNSLCNQLWKDNDRLIISEDDNIFSPNFLKFMNKGLELFKDDKTVDSICGYLNLNYKDIKTNGNTYFRCPCACCWGMGIWKDRIEELNKISTKYFRNSLSFKNIVKTIKLGRNTFLAYLASMCPVKCFWMNDVNMTIRMVIDDKCQIVPTTSLVRNIGVMSGENFTGCAYEIASLFLSQEISSEKDFHFIGTGNEYQCLNIQRWVKNELLFHKKFHWTTWQEVLKKTIKRVIKIIMGDFGWTPK